MPTTIEQVEEFHRAFGLPVNKITYTGDEKVNDLRVALIKEELDELSEALGNRDTIEVLDALTDLQYVLDGAYLSLGMAHLKDRAFEEVHRSNMSKLGEDGKPVYRESDGKVLKGPNYEPPNLMQFFTEGSA